MLTIVTTPSKILTNLNKPVVSFDDKLIKLVKEMDEALTSQTDPEGVGLAAPQIGKNLQLFIIKPSPDSKTKSFINPRIVSQLNQSESVKSVRVSRNKLKTDSNRLKPVSTKLEGCLSIPRIWGPVKRAKKVLLEYQTVKGEKKEEWFSGFEAVIIQHEMDHLQGVLFTERVLQQKSALFEEKEGKLEKMVTIVNG